MEQHQTEGMPEMRRKRIHATVADLPMINFTYRQYQRSNWFYTLMGFSTGIGAGAVVALFVPRLKPYFLAVQISLLLYGLVYVFSNYRKMLREHREMKESIRNLMEMMERKEDGITPP